ncbi:hypothetical protein [Lachnoanaerobaculum umeaense]|uniref:hypothetical protein n=1 Tax=Lachnoanaerobaculum umeaense TaxID=617123 RepID=UPI000DB4CAC0|nr:hypothetical protein [Lachnoanaerobaculum umeaense]PZW93912.1 hypothetical protein C7439_12442 [Lachnoanaerobaculum umeaense]
MIEGESGFTGITGYSLAGLFAVYAMYKTEINEKPMGLSGNGIHKRGRCDSKRVTPP